MKELRRWEAEFLKEKVTYLKAAQITQFIDTPSNMRPYLSQCFSKNSNIYSNWHRTLESAKRYCKQHIGKTKVKWVQQ